MKILSSLFFLLLAGVISAAAQISYTAAKVVFDHPGPFSQSQLETAAGIHPGTQFKADDLGAAAQRLIDSGYFTNVGATLAPGHASATTVLFGIEPLDRAQMLRVGYENFVWLTHTEIEDALHAKSPLFSDYLPESSPLADIFDQALTAALAAKGITAHVTHDTIEPTMRQPDRALEFRIASPSIRVANVKLSGVSPVLVPLIQKSVNSTANALYDEGLTGTTTQDRILAPLLDAGYIQATLSAVTVTPTRNGDSASVVLSAMLAPGDIYRVSGIAFAGTPLLAAESFAATVKLHPGDIASRSLLFETLAPLDAAYRRQGYMDVVVQAVPKPDVATHQVAYTVSVNPGEQYRVHEITADNLDPAARADFNRGFTMKTGQLFNPEYANNFLKMNTALIALEGYRGTWKAYADPGTHTVDVVFTFMR